METEKNREGFHGFLMGFSRPIVIVCRSAMEAPKQAGLG
ncbi:hypothetical protein ACUXSM_005487 [Burkholderia sp. 132550021-2]|jgi:hypothetical protein